MKSLAETVRAAQSGDQRAYEVLVREFMGLGYGYAYALLGDRHLAQDATQDALIEAHRHLSSLRSADAFPGWFRRIVRYRCHRVIRKRRMQTVSLDLVEPLQANTCAPRQEIEQRETNAMVARTVEALPRDLRETVALFYLSGLAQREIADFLEISPNTVKSRLHAARSQIRQRLHERNLNMMDHAFEDYALPADFTGRVIRGIPVLEWGKSGHTTYIAAVSASLALTDRPFAYDDLMVFTALAFRLRYVRRNDRTAWCTVGPVGQFPEEADAISRSTGHRQTFTRDREEKKRWTMAAVDRGLCPTAYIRGDTGVIYGYDDGGDTVLVRCFDLGEGFHSLPFSEVTEGAGPFFLEPTHPPPALRDSVTRGVLAGLVNWRRGSQPGENWQPWREAGAWEYTFGATAWDHWIDDLRHAHEISREALKSLFTCHAFTSYTLYDARLTAARFLAAHGERFSVKYPDLASPRPHAISATSGPAFASSANPARRLRHGRKLKTISIPTAGRQRSEKGKSMRWSAAVNSTQQRTTPSIVPWPPSGNHLWTSGSQSRQPDGKSTSPMIHDSVWTGHHRRHRDPRGLP